MPEPPPKTGAVGYVLAISQIGFEMVIPIILGVFLDQWIGTTPWLFVSGVVLGLFGGFAHLIVLLRRMERAETEEKPPQKPS